MGIGFDFPVMPGTQACSLDDHRNGVDGTGIGYFCDETLPILNASEQDLGRGYLYSFIGTVSRDFSEGRDCWFTDARDWYRISTTSYYVRVNGPSKCDYRVHSPTVIQRPDGTSAIVFASDEYTDTKPSSPLHPMLAILNMRSGHSRHFSGLAFYFYDFSGSGSRQQEAAAPMSYIRKVIDSVTYFRPSL